MKPLRTINHSVSAFKTQPLAQSQALELVRLAIIIGDNFLNETEWTVELHDGSLTIQKIDNNQAVVKLFVDPDQTLKGKLFASPPAGLFDVVVGIELGSYDPYVADSLRDRILVDFGAGYADPRSGSPASLVSIQPIQGHCYDVAFLSTTECPFEVDEGRLEMFFAQLQKGGKVAFPARS